MKPDINYWNRVLLIGAGVFAGTAFCMKWIEGDFLVNGEKFTIIGLELFYTSEKMVSILSGLDGHTQTILRYHLVFDFAFMAGVYPAIAALCMMARKKMALQLINKILVIVALLQLLAWACDIIENCYLLSWIQQPSSVIDLGLFHFIVATKWVIALGGVLLSIPLILFSKKGNSF